jgi:alkylated DNA repair protein (DNA oxidative demethylase)
LPDWRQRRSSKLWSSATTPAPPSGWHRDRPLFEHVLGISLGTAAVMRFRRRRGDRFERATETLPPRSIYHLTGEARHLWEHSIAALDRTRWSITFRSLSDRGRATTAAGGPGTRG